MMTTTMMMISSSSSRPRPSFRKQIFPSILVLFSLSIFGTHCNAQTIDMWPNVDWAVLSPKLQESAMILGYNETTWDNRDNGLIVSTSCVRWDQLTMTEQEAARDFGFTEFPWNYQLSDEVGECPPDWWAPLQWDELPVVLQQAAITFGYDQVTWDSGEPIEIDCYAWDDMTEDQQEAAEDLGYTQESWDEGGRRIYASFVYLARKHWRSQQQQYFSTRRMDEGDDFDWWDDDWSLDDGVDGGADDDVYDDVYGVDDDMYGFDDDGFDDDWVGGDDDEVEAFCEELFGTSSGISSGICLSGYSRVQVLGKEGYTFVNEVERGDKVLVSTTAANDGSGLYQEVYLFGHQDVYAFSEVLQITTRGNPAGHPLEITGNHLVAVSKQKQEHGGVHKTVRADSIRVGDVLVANDKGGIGTNESGVVLEISSIRHPGGLYSPITKDGMFLANGILVSSYTAVKEDHHHPESFTIGKNIEVASHHFMSHAAMAPFRFLCLTTRNSRLCEQRNHEGRLLFLVVAKRLATGTTKRQVLFWEKQLQAIATIVLWMSFLPFYFMEQLVDGSILMCLFPLAWLLVARFLYVSFRNNNKKKRIYSTAIEKQPCE